MAYDKCEDKTFMLLWLSIIINVHIIIHMILHVDEIMNCTKKLKFGIVIFFLVLILTYSLNVTIKPNILNDTNTAIIGLVFGTISIFFVGLCKYKKATTGGAPAAAHTAAPAAHTAAPAPTNAPTNAAVGGRRRKLRRIGR
jgi:hypothetical protein